MGKAKETDENLWIRLILHDIFNQANTNGEALNRKLFDEALIKLEAGIQAIQPTRRQHELHPNKD